MTWSQQQRLDASRAAATQLAAEHAELAPEASRPGVEQLIGPDRTRDRLVALTHSTREKVLSFAPAAVLTEAAIDASRPLSEELLDRGVARSRFEAGVRAVQRGCPVAPDRVGSTTERRSKP
ncbi:hypothetical protein ACF08M_00530 [Streptomyces sp. NPDC015032]|uniref:hypothetical protein n=1 Tax=Streptomyces sp. NPDC015032 TaxID=3364937 RepID=UPI0036FC5C4E